MYLPLWVEGKFVAAALGSGRFRICRFGFRAVLNLPLCASGGNFTAERTVLCVRLRAGDGHVTGYRTVLYLLLRASGKNVAADRTLLCLPFCVNSGVFTADGTVFHLPLWAGGGKVSGCALRASGKSLHWQQWCDICRSGFVDEAFSG